MATTNDIKFNVKNGLAVGASGFEVINPAGEWVGASGPGQSPYGATGAQGEYGASGITGEQGATGAQGSQGLDGATGFTGTSYSLSNGAFWIGANVTESGYAQLEFSLVEDTVFQALVNASVGDVIEVNFAADWVETVTIVENSGSLTPAISNYAIAVSKSPYNDPSNGGTYTNDPNSYVKFLSAVGYQGAT